MHNNEYVPLYCTLRSNTFTCITSLIKWLFSNINCQQKVHTLCPRKKRPKCFFVISLNSGTCDKTWQIVSWINLLQNHVNVFHLTWIVSLHYTLWNLWNLKCSSHTCYNALLDRETQEFIQPQLWPANSLDLNPVDNIVWEILQERCTKHASLICSYRQRHWRMAAVMTTWCSLALFVLRGCVMSSRSVMQVSHAWIVTKRTKVLPTCLHHMKENSSAFSDTKNGWWWTPPSTWNFGSNWPTQLQNRQFSMDIRSYRLRPYN